MWINPQGFEDGSVSCGDGDRIQGRLHPFLRGRAVLPDPAVCGRYILDVIASSVHEKRAKTISYSPKHITSI